MTEMRFAPYHDIATTIAEALARDSGQEVLVASGGVANAIAAELLRKKPNGAAGLRIETIETFARRIVNATGDLPRVASDAERRLAMRTAIRSIDDPMMESRGIAAMIERSWRDVRDSGMTLAEVESRLRAARGMRNPARTRLVVRAWREYERLVNQLGAIDPAELLARAVKVIERGKVAIAPQIVAGFYDMTGAQRNVVEALRNAGKLDAIYVPAAAGDAYRFADPFIERFEPAPQRDNIVAIPQWSAAQYDTRTIELAEVCRAVGELLRSGAAPAGIGIVARTLDPYDIALLSRFAKEEGFALTAADEIPLAAHRLGRALSVLLQLREREFPRGDIVELLRDGFAPKNAVDIDAIDLATRRARIAGGTSAALKPLARNAAIETYAAIVAEVEGITPANLMSGNEAAGFLSAALARFRIETELDLAAAEAIDAIAAMFRRASAWDATFDATVILDALAQVSLPPPTPHSPLPTIFCSDIMRFRGRSFAHLFAIRMQDDLFPQGRVDDPLLPDQDRRALGVREIGDGRDEERMLFQLLLDGAESIHFSFAGGDGFAKVLRPSPLLKSFVIAQRPERRAELLKNFGAAFVRRRDAAGPAGGTPAFPRLRQLQLVAKSGSRSTFDGYLFAEHDDDVLRARLASAITSVSPTQLEDFGECPQKFFFKHILGIRDIDDPEHELQLNARDKGKLDHGILEQFYRGLSEDDFARLAAALPQLENEIGSRIDMLVDDAFAAMALDAPPFNPTMRAIERTATKRILREFVAHDVADLESTGFRPKHFEYRFGKARHGKVSDHPEAFVLGLGGGAWGVGSGRENPGFGSSSEGGARKDSNDDAPSESLAHSPPSTPHTLIVQGTIDRIDARPQGYRIVDYKGGKALRHKDLGKKIERGVRLQLALYAMAVAQFFGAESSSVSGAIKPLVAGETNATKFAFELAEKESALRETLDLFVSSILGGVFPAFPADDDDDFNACKYCPVNHSCRTRHDFVEKYTVTRFGEPRTLLGERE
ncbi:MAG: ATP-dependent helicase/nuclease subunit [Thermoanaerobaculia bacterium]|jgi:RecB family exonuclease|nr:ATP-dependent helicase/nuclease subunit [Thermoanaerobaculia bacterium]